MAVDVRDPWLGWLVVRNREGNNLFFGRSAVPADTAISSRRLLFQIVNFNQADSRGIIGTPNDHCVGARIEGGDNS